MSQLKKDRAAKTTLQTALAAISWYAARVGLQSDAKLPAIRAIAAKHALAISKDVVKEAAPYEVDILGALEEGIVCDS